MIFIRPSWKLCFKVSLVCILVTLLFAAPHFIFLGRSAFNLTEMQLGRLIATSFGGLTLSLSGAIAASMLWAKRSLLRIRADTLVAFGHPPRKIAISKLFLSLVLCSFAVAFTGALFVILVRVLSTLTHIALYDALSTGWALFLGFAFWLSLALTLVARSGKPHRAYFVIGIDLVLRLAPGPAAWFAPSTHIANLLGAPPPTHLVKVPVVSQWLSVAVLFVLTTFIFLTAMQRYQGRPKE